MTRKPDWWERMVRKAYGNIRMPVVEQMLRREHKAVVREMTRLTRYDEGIDYRKNQKYIGVFEDGVYVRLDDVLDALAKRAR